MINLNFRNQDFFEYRFKRKPKMWSLQELHDLWDKACDRAALRTIERQAIIKRIVTETQPIEKYRGEKTYQAYFKHDNDNDSLWVYDFRYYPEHDSYGHSSDRYKPSDDTQTSRDEKLHQMLNPVAFELGQKFYELKKLDTNLHYRVRQVLWEKVEDILRGMFKGKVPSEIFTIDICGHTYFVQTDNQSRGLYNKFEMKGVYNPKNIIKINDTTGVKA